MGKRNNRRSAGQDDTNVGCVWGLMRMIYFRRDPRFLMDAKQANGRHKLREITGKIMSFTNHGLILVLWNLTWFKLLWNFTCCHYICTKTKQRLASPVRNPEIGHLLGCFHWLASGNCIYNLEVQLMLLDESFIRSAIFRLS